MSFFNEIVSTYENSVKDVREKMKAYVLETLVPEAFRQIRQSAKDGSSGTVFVVRNPDTFLEEAIARHLQEPLQKEGFKISSIRSHTHDLQIKIWWV